MTCPLQWNISTSFIYFPIGLLLFFLILSLFCHLCGLQIFLVCTCLFILLTRSFTEQMILILMKYNLSDFLMDNAFGDISTNSSPSPRSQRFLLWKYNPVPAFFTTILYFIFLHSTCHRKHYIFYLLVYCLSCPARL